MIIRRLFALVLTIAMTLAPLGMPAMAEVTTPASHHDAMTSSGHCDQQVPDKHHKAADKNCCVAMCIAVVIPANMTELPFYHVSRERPASDLDRRGFLGEIATPPPRSA
ncbi:hypothetical protein LZ518_07350 [Sphingomonas sp. RB56-2]|uniref:DUF2946 domain-containing protein n=1 Tax=Sphingomonas brevis TaxID=2908206 RepID=A0ABT0S9Y7_9SPHN|nr:hypothetical protein [Sphingomonas brevis]MCL6740945.1 hypothetical protein [Sphingomonas brevis]